MRRSKRRPVRIIYFDLDCLRPDHLGCYGYERNTSPNIDAICERGIRFDAVYASDTPCLPSRTALFTGRFGTQTGVVGHGGSAADPIPEGPTRGFNSLIGRTSWMRALRDVGLKTASISPFAERHGAHHFTANFNEIINTGKRGLENADEIGEQALDWIKRHRGDDDWFLHVNFWDPHTPYRVPESFGNPFEGEPLPSWYSEAVRAEHWNGVGPHSAREVTGFDDDPRNYPERWPRHPIVIDSMQAARAMFDGYDTGILYADTWVGNILEALGDKVEDCAFLVSADHGENLGELNIYADHQTADEHTARVPFIITWPGLLAEDSAGAIDSGLHYQMDMAATVIELAGGVVPNNWDGQSFAVSLQSNVSGVESPNDPPVRKETGRESLILSHGAWSCQRAVRFRSGGHDFICIHSYHDGLHAFPDVMLFDLTNDPHEQHDLAETHPELVAQAMARLEGWHGEMMRLSPHKLDPMWSVMREGGPKHVRGELDDYVKRLRATGRSKWADELVRKHGDASRDG